MLSREIRVQLARERIMEEVSPNLPTGPSMDSGAISSDMQLKQNKTGRLYTASSTRVGCSTSHLSLGRRYFHDERETEMRRVVLLGTLLVAWGAPSAALQVYGQAKAMASDKAEITALEKRYNDAFNAKDVTAKHVRLTRMAAVA
jgi:hypothetical protein